MWLWQRGVLGLFSGRRHLSYGASWGCRDRNVGVCQRVATVTSHVRERCLCQDINVRPTGRLPSVRNRPEYSFVTEFLAEANAREMVSLRTWCLVIRLGAMLHTRPHVSTVGHSPPSQNPVVKVVLWSREAHLTKPGWSKPHTHSNPTNLALFNHKITLYRFNRGLILLRGGSNGSRGLTSPPRPPSLQPLTKPQEWKLSNALNNSCNGFPFGVHCVDEGVCLPPLQGCGQALKQKDCFCSILANNSGASANLLD